MNKKKFEELFAEYLSGEMNARKEAKFRKLLEQHGYSPGELTGLEEMNKLMESYEIPEPGEEMHDRFYSMLAAESQKIKLKQAAAESKIGWFHSLFEPKIIPRLVYSLALILIGWGFGSWQNSGGGYDNQLNKMSVQIEELRSITALALLNQPSAAGRIKAVNLAGDIPSINDKITDALINTLNTDTNVNVRLAAAETLYKLVDHAGVRDGLVQSISSQDSPIMQLAMVEIMVALRESRSVEEFNKLLEKPDLYYAVRTKIEQAIKLL